MPNNKTMRVLALMLAAVSLLSTAVFAAEGDASREPEETAEAAGTDASVLLPDGSYTPDTFTFSGGTGRVTAECDEVIVKDGKAYAVITVSSANYTYFKANGRTCYTTHAGKTSTATIPVRLNATNTVYGLTTAMSTPHEVAYTVYIHIEGAVAGEDNTTKAAQKIPDLVFLSEDTNKASALFEVYRYEKGYAVINVLGVARYLVVPAGAEVPGAPDGDIMVVRQPVSNVYVSAPELSDTILSIDAEGIAEMLTLKGYEDGAEGAAFAGSYTQPDFPALLRGRCRLAVLPADFADGRVCRGDSSAAGPLSAGEAEALRKVFEGFKGFGIPAFVDRSADETDELAKLEWIKLYGILLGCEKEADAAFADSAKKLESAA